MRADAKGGTTAAFLLAPMLDRVLQFSCKLLYSYHHPLYKPVDLFTWAGSVFIYTMEVLMNKSLSFLEPGEQVIVYRKGLTIQQWIGTFIWLLIISALFTFCAIVIGFWSTYSTIVIFIILPLYWLFVLISFIIRAVFFKGILTDRRIIFRAYDMPWSRIAIPLTDIESMSTRATSIIEIKLRSQKLNKLFNLKNARGFVEAYQKLVDSNPSN